MELFLLPFFVNFLWYWNFQFLLLIAYVSIKLQSNFFFIIYLFFGFCPFGSMFCNVRSHGYRGHWEYSYENA